MLMRFNKIYLFIIAFCLLVLTVISFYLSKSSYNDDYKINEFHLEYDGKFHQNLFDISNFTFLLRPNGNLCNYTNIEAVFIVTSHISNVETRSVMRRAFPMTALCQLGFTRVFLLGITPDNKYVNQKAIIDEHNRYGDIVQGNFLEAYKNLTYKHVMGLWWVSQYCDNAKFTIKMDDDIIVNVLKLKDLLKRFNPQENFIAGYVLKNLLVRRQKVNKWYVGRDEYLPDVYPPFVSGWLYITTPSVCRKLENLARFSKYFWIDDVYVTGLLAQNINLKLHDIKEFFTDHPQYFQCCMDDLAKYKFDCDKIVGPNGGRTNLFYEFNRSFSKCIKGACLERTFPINPACVGKRNTPFIGNGSADISIYKLF